MRPVPAAEQQPRTITIYCTAGTCVEAGEDIALLQSFFDGGYEIWKVGVGGEQQRLIHRDDVAQDLEILERRGMIAHREKIQCRRCDYDVTTADKLGMGVRAMAHQRGGRRGPRDQVAVPPLIRLSSAQVAADESIYLSPGRQKVMAALSSVADSGFTRLPLAVLDRIVKMP